MIHLDLSQLLADPRQSGIQRAERELIRHWPSGAPLVPCIFDPGPGQMRALPSGLLDALRAEDALDHDGRPDDLLCGMAADYPATRNSSRAFWT